MTPLNENHARHILSTFRHVDRILEKIARLAQDEPSPFARARLDVPPRQARILRSRVARVRSRLLSGLDQLGIARPEPEGSARWTMQTALRFARIALSELRWGGLRGYGALDAATDAEVEALAAELEELMLVVAAVLREPDPGAPGGQPDPAA